MAAESNYFNPDSLVGFPQYDYYYMYEPRSYHRHSRDISFFGEPRHEFYSDGHYMTYYRGHENVLGMSIPGMGSGKNAGSAEPDLPTDPASMYLNPTMLADGKALVAGLPKMGDPTKMAAAGAKMGFGLIKKIPVVGGVVGAVEDAGKIGVGLAQGKVPTKE